MKASHILIISIILIFFIFGWFSNLFYLTEYSNLTKEYPSSILTKEKISPRDRISASQILVLDDKVILEIAGVNIAYYTDTNSMDPIIDEGANGLEIIPKNKEDIQVGDIIAYRSPLIDILVVHRVVKIGYDQKGWYAITKGDNSFFKDPIKVRFSQVRYVVIGVIY